MSEFKPGDEVQFVTDDSWKDRDVEEGTRATFIRYGERPGQSGGLPLVALEDGFEFLCWDDVLEPYKEPTPAPLDPSKVKAGDTVTLERESKGLSKVDGTVVDVHHDGSTGGIGVMINNITQYVFWLNEWTLTAHQPAPEPEPELPTLPVATGSLILDAKHDMRYFRANGLDYPWVSETGTWHDDRYAQRLPDVRPLVVIDPAAVDVDALIDDSIKSAQRTGYWPDTIVGGHMIRHALAELGIVAS